MNEGSVRVYYGNGAGKSSAALGYALRAAADGKTAIIIQFLKAEVNYDYLSKLEPEIRIFRFERTKECFSELSSDEQEDEKLNIRNGVAFAKKVISTGECDLLILDEILGAVNEGIVPEEEVVSALSLAGEGMEVILTGRSLPNAIREVSSSVYNITPEKEERDNAGI
ncbi:MAG: cob(I)yrinic acid a,c-diamide adenosyltransferase [Lachnospiraceae bacterium]|nr:cob(I)yrinic acid a,c-diamide adenosyltransferase [Lachnospiraceae bacterium]